MGTFHFYDFIAVIVFILLVVLSFNETVLGQLERDLGNHMILEHILFFSIGVLSVYVAEGILRFIVSNERNSFVGSKSEIHQLSSSSATGRAIQYWKAILRRIFKLNTHPWSWIVIAGTSFLYGIYLQFLTMLRPMIMCMLCSTSHSLWSEQPHL
jgi:hypothetical protein